MNCAHHFQNQVSLICIAPHKCQFQRKLCVECQYEHGVKANYTKWSSRNSFIKFYYGEFGCSFYPMIVTPKDISFSKINQPKNLQTQSFFDYAANKGAWNDVFVTTKDVVIPQSELRRIQIITTFVQSQMTF